MEPGRFDGTISPLIRVVSAVASISVSAASLTLKRAQGSVTPISPFIAATMSSPRAWRFPVAASSLSRRSAGPVCDQAGKAQAAASTARVASARLAAAASVTTSPVTGLARAKRRSPSAGRC
jgi:hypothetical protein